MKKKKSNLARPNLLKGSSFSRTVKRKINSSTKPITVADKEHENWYKDAKHQTLQTLPKFLNHIINDYTHDYGTICHAIAAGALGAASATDRSNQGGITGFQASAVMSSAVMWNFIRQWQCTENPMKLVDFGDMLYPQYNGEFQKTISQDIADWLKKTAQKFIDNNGNNPIIPSSSTIIVAPSPKVLAHWTRLAAGQLPFGYTIKKP